MKIKKIIILSALLSSASSSDLLHKTPEEVLKIDPKSVLHLSPNATEKDKHKAIREYLLLKEMQKAEKKRRSSVSEISLPTQEDTRQRRNTV